MNVVYDHVRAKVIQGDCRTVMAEMPGNSIDAIVCDPPYNLSFMGRAFDTLGTPKEFQAWCETWAIEVLRVLKPGGHMVAFGSPRTFHRLTCALEDSGFEVRDTIGSGSGMVVWCYGVGFPKGRNVSEDSLVCQCLRNVRGQSTEDAAQSAAQVLLSDLRRAGEAVGTDLADLHGLPVNIHPDYALSSDTKPDVFTSVCTSIAKSSNEGQAVHTPSGASGTSLCVLRNATRATSESSSPDKRHVLFQKLSGESACRDDCSESLRLDRQDREAALRLGQSGMERRRYIQEGEGQLRRSGACSLPTGPHDDGTSGRLHNGTSTSHGTVDRTSTLEDGMCESHRSESEEQCTQQPRIISVERRSQTRRGWPLCAGCGKPQIPTGLNTALKPAYEPIVLVRKPLSGTIVQTILEHGTGALNIDACRIGLGSDKTPAPKRRNDSASWFTTNDPTNVGGNNTIGRYPANLVLDEAAAEMVDEASSGIVHGAGRARTEEDAESYSRSRMEGWGNIKGAGFRFGDSGGASRFFYISKASSRERDLGMPHGIKNTHNTVKPLRLMSWLCKLITPPGGTILDPFGGSFSTGIAAIAEGFNFIGIEQDTEYVQRYAPRIEWAATNPHRIWKSLEPKPKEKLIEGQGALDLF